MDRYAQADEDGVHGTPYILLAQREIAALRSR